MARIVSFVALLIIVALVGVLAFQVMSSFLLPMFLALVLTVIFRPLHKWFVARARGHERLAALVTTLAILLIVLLPTVLILSNAAVEAYALATEVNPESVRESLGKLRQKFGLELPPRPVQDSINVIDNLLALIEPTDPPRALDKQRDDLKQLLERTQRLHAELLADRPDNHFSAEEREAILADWQSFNEAVQVLAQSVNSPAFDDALDNANRAYRALYESLYGKPTMALIRRQVNPDREQIEKLQNELRDMVSPFALGAGQAVGGFVGGLFIGLAVMIISLYYFLADGPTMIRAVMHLSPLDDRYEEQLLNEFTTISRAVVLATLLSAFAQGMLASIGYYFAGFNSVFLLTVVTMLFALIPFVGAAGVWGACSVWLLIEGHTTTAIGLAIYGTLVVSMIDNLIKPMVLHGQSKLHPLLALLSILGGITTLGPIGIFVGPMGVAFLQALLNMLHAEIVALDEPEKTEGDKPPAKAEALPKPSTH